MVKTSMARHPLTVARATLIALVMCGMLFACADPVGNSMTKTEPNTREQQPSQQGTPQAALQAALMAYTQEKLSVLADMLPAKYVGRNILLDTAQTTINEQKQLRITLSDVRVQPGTSLGSGAPVVALTARWDKRYLKLPTLAPAVEAGTLQAVMHLDSGQWVLDSLSPDNPFVR